LFREGEFDRFRDMGRSQDSLVRSFRRVVSFDGFRTDFFFGDKFYRGAEEVVKESPFFGIEIVEQRNDWGVVQAIIPCRSQPSGIMLLKPGIFFERNRTGLIWLLPIRQCPG